MTSYLNHGVKAKMCEATPFAARAQVELLFDSLRSQGKALSTCIGLSEGIAHQATESNQHIAKSLLKNVNNTWSTMVMRTMPFPTDLLQDVHPNRQTSMQASPMASSTDNVGNRNS